MDLWSGALVFFLIWWLVLFTVLPWGIRHVRPRPDGHDPGAPANPRMITRLAVTTVIAALIFGLVHLLVAFDMIQFRGA